ncbi:unnamed protein product [Brachionus calyciflorus]|uniref:Zinc finger PHD-type domain-containing protein n=1 Tax=Brachionus calyciflorus TaxID=104777 RepID=A0A813M0V1_9BILA|nr:unnamed protein product [Brachionus calyciflorus]
MTETSCVKKNKTFKKRDLLKMSQNASTSSTKRSTNTTEQTLSDTTLIKLNPFFEDFVDCIENLPSRLQLLLTELRNVDVLVKARHRKMQILKQEILARSESNENEESKKSELDLLLNKLHQLLIQCQTLGDQKVRLSGQIIEAIGTKTRQLGFDARTNETKFNIEIDEEKILSEFKLACKKNRPIHHHYNAPGSSSTSRTSTRQVQQNLSTKPKANLTDLNKKCLNKKSLVNFPKEKDLYSFDESSNLSNSPFLNGVNHNLMNSKSDCLSKKKPLNQRVNNHQLSGFKSNLELKRSGKKVKIECENNETKNHSDSSTQLTSTRSKRQLNFAASPTEPPKKTLNQSLKLNKKRRISLSTKSTHQSPISSSSSNQCKSPSSLSSSSSTSSSYNKNKYLTNNNTNITSNKTTTTTTIEPTVTNQPKQNDPPTFNLPKSQKENIKINSKQTAKNQKTIKRLNTKKKKKTKIKQNENENEVNNDELMSDVESEYETDDEVSQESHHSDEQSDHEKDLNKTDIKKEIKTEDNCNKEDNNSDRNSNETESIKNLDEDDENQGENEPKTEEKLGPKNKKIKQEIDDEEHVEKNRKKSTRNSRNNLTDLVPTPTTTMTTNTNKIIKSSHDEPLYCLCREISYGQMIMCDNDACNIEWFHFNCVKLANKPKVSEQSGNYYFYVVNRFDCLIYEKDLIKQSPTGEKKKDDTPYFYQFIAHASLDCLDEKLNAKSSSSLYYPNIDRFNQWNISAYVTPSFLRFLILHEGKNDDGIKGFFQDVYETYIKFLLNPFYDHNESIKSEAFDRKVNMASKKFLGV